MSDSNGKLLLTDKDFVEVVDAEGNDLPPVPKHWGEDDLPAGATKKKAASSKPKAKPAGSDGSSGDPTEPKGNAPTEEWAAYAKAKGAEDSDLLDADGAALTRDALRAKYGTATS